MTWFATVASPRLVDKSRATQNVLPGATVLRCQGQVGMMIQREYTQICGINVGSMWIYTANILYNIYIYTMYINM